MDGENEPSSHQSNICCRRADEILDQGTPVVNVVSIPENCNQRYRSDDEGHKSRSRGTHGAQLHFFRLYQYLTSHSCLDRSTVAKGKASFRLPGRISPLLQIVLPVQMSPSQSAVPLGLVFSLHPPLAGLYPVLPIWIFQSLPTALRMRAGRVFADHGLAHRRLRTFTGHVGEGVLFRRGTHLPTKTGKAEKGSDLPLLACIQRPAVHRCPHRPTNEVKFLDRVRYPKRSLTFSWINSWICYRTRIGTCWLDI
jgi:hypothetical protein